MKKMMFLIASALLPLVVFGRVRVDVHGVQVTLKEVKATGLSVGTTPAKATEKISKAVLISGTIGKEWKKFEFSFVPEKDGRVILRFHTPGSRNINAIIPVLVDNVQAAGGTLLNGSFETVKNGKLTGWNLGTKGKIITGDNAADGKQCVQTFFSSGMATQAMVVSAGEKVTVTFMAKPLTEN